MDLTGKVSLITGAARRVGRAIAVELADAGCDLAVHYQTSTEAARDLARQIEALGRRVALVRGDLTDPETPAKMVAQTIQALGRIDILVNNAAVFTETPLDRNDLAAWEAIFRTNVFAPAMLTRSAVPFMRSAGAGRIINLTDIHAERPIRHHDAYCASKAALESLTRSFARELAPQITVNAIAPGIAVFPDSCREDLRRQLIARVPLGRQGTPGEIAAAVRFLVTAGDYITGQVIRIDGGRSIVP